MEVIEHRILEKIKKLKALDRRFALFGAKGHKYEFKEPISEIELENIERKYGFNFPKDYRYFITKIGNRGPGPDYGFFGLTINNRRHLDGQFNYKKVQKKIAEEYWDEDREILLKDYKTLLEPYFPDINNTDTQLLFNKINNLGIDIKGPYNSNPPGDFEELFNETEVELDELNGFVGVVDVGCGHMYILIVRGERAGEIVFYGNYGQPQYTGNTFIEFYEKWLDKSLAIFERINKKLKTTLSVDLIIKDETKNHNNWRIGEMILSILDEDEPNFSKQSPEYIRELNKKIEKWKKL